MANIKDLIDLVEIAKKLHDWLAQRATFQQNIAALTGVEPDLAALDSNSFLFGRHQIEILDANAYRIDGINVGYLGRDFFCIMSKPKPQENVWVEALPNERYQIRGCVYNKEGERVQK